MIFMALSCSTVLTLTQYETQHHGENRNFRCNVPIVYKLQCCAICHRTLICLSFTSVFVTLTCRVSIDYSTCKDRVLALAIGRKGKRMIASSVEMKA